VLVDEAVYPAFVAAVTARAKAAVTGDGFAAGTEYGPLNNKMQFDRVHELVQDALAGGATATAGGAPVAGTGDQAGHRVGDNSAVLARPECGLWSDNRLQPATSSSRRSSPARPARGDTAALH
jgi:hypothetical protein